nr:MULTISPECIES: hypothetical protein [unclassified Bradyrhizobium]
MAKEITGFWEAGFCIPKGKSGGVRRWLLLAWLSAPRINPDGQS